MATKLFRAIKKEVFGLEEADGEPNCGSCEDDGQTVTANRALKNEVFGLEEAGGGPNCGSCEDDGQTVTAVRYCLDCEEYQCGKCFKSHERYNKGHEVFDESLKSRWGEKKREKLPTQKCPTHTEEILQIYCENHGALCCPVCVAMNHSSCSQKRYIPEVSTDIAFSREFKTLDDHIASLSSHLKTVIAESMQNKESIKKSGDEYRREILETRRMIKSVVNKLVANMPTEGEQEHARIDRDVDDRIRKSNELLVKVQKLQQRVDPVANTNDTQLYINMKQVREELKGLVSKVEQVSKPQPKGIEYKMNPTVKKFLSCNDGLFKSKVIHNIGVKNIPLVHMKKKTATASRFKPY